MKISTKNFYFSPVRNSYRTLAFTTILGFGLGLSACSGDTKTAGGGPSGTEAGNAITAQIMTADAKPAAQARIKLINSESLDTESDAYTATADENGSVTIEGIAKGDYILEASQGGTALQQNVSFNGEDIDLGSATLEKMVSVAGAITENGSDTLAANGTIKVRGMEHSAPVKNGAFKLDSLPAGHLDLVFIPSDSSIDTISAYVTADAGKSVSTSTFANESKSLLLDDFEDGDSQHRFGPMYFGFSDGGWWYNISSDKVIATLDSSISRTISLSSDNGNTAFHIGYDFSTLKDSTILDADGEVVSSWANLGVQIGSNNKSICYDLTSVDSVAFKAKGNGNTILHLVDETLTTTNTNIATAEISLDTAWVRYSYSLKDIHDSNSGSLSCVTMLTWEFTGDVDFWLDDIELVHGDKASIWKK